MNTRYIFAVAGILGALSVPACDLEVGDLNNPGLDELEENPTAITVAAACTGLLIGTRRNRAAPNGLVSQLGILGRESYNFDDADPRFIEELIEAPLDQGSPFGGNFWAGPYLNLRLANVTLRALDRVSSDQLSDPQKSAIRGFIRTIQALDLLEVIVTHDTNGGVIDTDRPIGDPLGPIVDRVAVYAEIVRLLEAALPDLDKSGDSFPFPMSSGFHSNDDALTFDTPAGFRKLNRAIRARVAVYLKDYAGALTALSTSFLDDNVAGGIDFDHGVYYSYSTKSGDAQNGLITTTIYAHPSFETGAMKNGTELDARYTRKIGPAKKTGSNGPLVSNIQFSKLYPNTNPGAPVALIRNEELILLKAEALFFTGMVGPAMVELNLVRTLSGALPALVGTPPEATFIDQLLYERRYSLMFEGGHRWIDLRRLGRTIPLDVPAHVPNVRYPIPLPECNARPGEPRCLLGST